MIVKVPPENALVWVCGKFPGRIHKRINGTCRFTSGVPRYQRDRDFKINEILWEESRSRWYTMDPNARPIVGRRPTDAANKHLVTLEQHDTARTMLREGSSIGAIMTAVGINEGEVKRISAEIQREFWEGK